MKNIKTVTDKPCTFYNNEWSVALSPFLLKQAIWSWGKQILKWTTSRPPGLPWYPWFHIEDLSHCDLRRHIVMHIHPMSKAGWHPHHLFSSRAVHAAIQLLLSCMYNDFPVRVCCCAVSSSQPLCMFWSSWAACLFFPPTDMPHFLQFLPFFILFSKLIPPGKWYKLRH